MGSFRRDLLPDTAAFFESEGLTLTGRGKWRTTRCEFHDGSDSMRVNTESGGWICMACGAKGGDVLAYVMQRDDLEFVEAARKLGAYDESAGRASGPPPKPATLGPRDAMQVVAFELNLIMVVVSDAIQGTLPSAADWTRFLQGAGRIDRLAAEYAP